MLIEFPQAFRQMLPIIIAQLVVLLKDTALGYIVGYNELIRTTMNNLAQLLRQPLPVLAVRGHPGHLPRDEPLAVVVRALARRGAPRAAASVDATAGRRPIRDQAAMLERRGAGGSGRVRRGRRGDRPEHRRARERHRRRSVDLCSRV